MTLKATLKAVRKRAASCLITSFAFLYVFAVPPAHAEDAASPALWLASDEDSVVYLFGTIHVLPPTLSWHSQKVDSAFRSAEMLILEAPALDTPEQEMRATVMKYAQNPTGVSLSSQLSPVANKLLVDAFKSFGMPEAQALGTKQAFEPLRPWFVGLQIAAMQMQTRGIDGKSGVEAVLFDAARKKEMKVSYLETMDQQFAMLAGLGQVVEIAMLEEALRDLDGQSAMLDRMINDWVSGNADAVGKEMQAAMTDPIVYEKLLTSRNQDWARQITELMMGSGTVFIAVGAGHLSGAGSLQDFLQINGIPTTRLQ